MSKNCFNVNAAPTNHRPDYLLSTKDVSPSHSTNSIPNRRTMVKHTPIYVIIHRHAIEGLSALSSMYVLRCYSRADTPHTDTLYSGTYYHSLFFFTSIYVLRCYSRETHHTQTQRHKDTPHTDTLYSGTYYHSCYLPQTQYIEGLSAIYVLRCYSRADTPHTDTETQTHYIAGLTITHVITHRHNI